MSALCVCVRVRVCVCDKDRHSRLWHLSRANLAMQQLAFFHPNETEPCVSFARDDAGYAETRGHPSHGAQQDCSGSLRMLRKRFNMCGLSGRLRRRDSVMPAAWSLIATSAKLVPFSIRGLIIASFLSAISPSLPVVSHKAGSSIASAIDRKS